MRARDDDPDIWGDLYERFRRPGDAPRRPRGLRSLPPESSTRLIDAALGILGSVRTFIDVAEDLLLERRSSAGDPGPQREPFLRQDEPAWVPQRDDESSAVHDIPLHGA